MKEHDWLTCEESIWLLEFLKQRASVRKLRLFAVACCRRIEHFLSDEQCQKGVNVAEKFADSEATVLELETSRQTISQLLNQLPEPFVGEQEPDDALILRWDALEVVRCATKTELSGAVFDSECDTAVALVASGCANLAGANCIGYADRAVERGREYSRQTDILRDIFGNPFRPPPPIEPSLLTPAVVALAGDIYQQRAFERLPDLAAALEAGGCRDSELLDHLRGPGPHVRGCWALDLVLGKQ